MKGKICFRTFIFTLILVLLTSSSWARLVVTDETRSWAKKVVKQEQGLKTVSEPNTLAILDFYNKTEWDKLDPLQKGLALMLMTDLSKVKCFQLVERAKVRALYDELDLRESALVNPQTQSRVGKLLGAENVVGGDIIKGKIGEFQMDSNLLKVRDEKVFGQPKAEGELLKGLFEMEKKLLFEIIGELKCKISPEEEAELKKPITTDLQTLLKLFEAVEYGDQGDYEKAEEMLAAILEDDPDFGLAREFYEEIKSLGKSAEGYTEAEPRGDVHRDEPPKEVDPVDDPYDRKDGVDNDHDGYTVSQGDCDDSDPNVHPGAMEICDGKDNDCNGLVDDGVGNIYYRDADGDGYGNPAESIRSCTQPSGYVLNNTDCNDHDGNVHPGATEICDGKDNDCNGLVDDGVGNIYYRDADGDGYGNPAESIRSCTQPSGYVLNNTDCNDHDGSVHPGATEICDGKDNDCNGLVDDGVGNIYYRDADGDGYGNPAESIRSCTQPSGYVLNNTDCNDHDGSVHPGATEICDGKDNDCNGLVDDGVGNIYYRDADGDGYGNPAESIRSCTQPSGYVLNNTDCDDHDGSVHPGATEICDGKDNDCNGLVDDGVGNIYYRDADGDGYGNPAESIRSCAQPSGYVFNSSDCNDNDSLVNPGMTEIVGNGWDDDCNPNTPDNPPDVSQPFIVDPVNTAAAAQEDYFNDPDLRDSVNKGDYIPGEFNPTAPGPYDGQRFPYIGAWPIVWEGPYKNGLQLVGMERTEAGDSIVVKYVADDTLALINGNPFLAYEVQVEEDRVNRKILEMAADGELLADINSQLQNGDILSRDNYLLEKADAQSGRVLRDAKGGWVRVQQYILRPDAQTVQILNVCLRSGDALSTMDFTTRFTGQGYPIESDLRYLDWASWLTTGYYVRTEQQFSNNVDVYPELASMYVKFTNPANESLQESRTFGGKYYPTSGNWVVQNINTDGLTIINSLGNTERYGYDYANEQPLGNGGFYLDATDGGFLYRRQSDKQAVAEVSFYSVDDMGTGEPSPLTEIHDIWSALSVNESDRLNEGQPPNIGNYNLNIVISNGDTDFFTQDIDVIYIPMSRMVWKEKGGPPWGL